jgi:hypothetical protein
MDQRRSSAILRRDSGGKTVGIHRRFVILVPGVCLSLATAASAQQATDAALVPQPSTAAPSAPASEAASASGPLVYLCDSAGGLGTLDLTTKAVHVIGSLGVVLTDIAFAPNGTLYGISFTDFYKVSTTTGKATRVGSLGVGGMNALAFSKSGQVTAASNSRTGFFRINITTGQASFAGSDGGFLSAGDLSYSGSHLYFSTSSGQLVDFNLSTHTRQAHLDHISNLFGLAVTAPGQLYGFANDALYKLNPSTGTGTVIADFGGHGLGQVFGAAFKPLF